MVVAESNKQNVLGMTPEALAAYFAELGEPRYRSTQLIKWLYQKSTTSFADMTDLSKSLRQKLEEVATISLPEIVKQQTASDGVVKWLLSVDGNNAIETVFIPEDDRGTLCVSSQVGCSLTCSFCATGHQGFNRNLTAAEIIAQVLIARRDLMATTGSERPVSNVVMMGMGEPLLNYDNVVAAIQLMLDDNAFGLSRRRVTLSTAGVVPRLVDLKNDCGVTLAVSLHAANDALRNELVPINKKYPLEQLIAQCKQYVADEPRARITWEYIMISGVNDSLDDARELLTLLEGVPSKVNLIPYNPVDGIAYERSSNNRVYAFRDFLQTNDMTAMIRKTRGQDIDAACGQLAGQFNDLTRRRQRFGERQLVNIEETRL